jgi:hypothetical protein
MLSVVMPNLVMLSVVMHSVVMLSVVMLNVAMLTVFLLNVVVQNIILMFNVDCCKTEWHMLKVVRLNVKYAECHDIF